jgi:hypothetical protein
MNKTLHTAADIYFSESKKSLVQSLFKPINGRTSSGTWTKLKNGVLFRDAKGEKRAFLVMNKWKEIFFVSCYEIEGKTYFMNGLSSKDEEFLGMKGLSYSEESKIAENIAACF